MEMDLTLDHQVSYFYTSHSSSQAEKTSESSLMPSPFQVMVLNMKLLFILLHD